MASLQELNDKIAELKADVDRLEPGVTDFQPQVDAVQVIKDEIDAKFPLTP